MLKKGVLRYGLVILLLFGPFGVTPFAHGTDYRFESFDYTGAVHTLPVDINDAGTVAGYWGDALDLPTGNLWGFSYDGTDFSLIQVPGSLDTGAFGINNAGVIVGHYYDTQRHGFSYDGSTYTPVDYPGADHTWAFGINDKGLLPGLMTTRVPVTDSSITEAPLPIWI